MIVRVRGRKPIAWAVLVTFSIGCGVPRVPARPPVGHTGGSGFATIRVLGDEARVNDRPARDGQSIRPGDEVATGVATSVVVDFDRAGRVQLDARTDPRFWEILTKGICQLKVLFDFGQAYVEGTEGDECKFVLQGPGEGAGSTIVNLIGTEVNVAIRPPRVTLTVIEGRAEIAGASPAVVARPGDQLVLEGRRVIAHRTLSRAELEDVTRWRARYRVPEARSPTGSKTTWAVIAAGAVVLTAGLVWLIRELMKRREDDRPGARGWCCNDGALVQASARGCRRGGGVFYGDIARRKAAQRCSGRPYQINRSPRRAAHPMVASGPAGASWRTAGD